MEKGGNLKLAGHSSAAAAAYSHYYKCHSPVLLLLHADPPPFPALQSARTRHSASPTPLPCLLASYHPKLRKCTRWAVIGCRATALSPKCRLGTHARGLPTQPYDAIPPHESAQLGFLGDGRQTVCVGAMGRNTRSLESRGNPSSREHAWESGRISQSNSQVRSAACLPLSMGRKMANGKG